jgi:hypothetical protein
VDAVYALESGYMGPFKNTRYHLQEFRDVPVESMTRQEKFNLTHSRLRNIIEWSFGILKARWQILDGVPHCNYLFIRHHGLGAATYRPDDWVALNADSTMSGLREYIHVALWGD